jgi:hypothetical protein
LLLGTYKYNSTYPSLRPPLLTTHRLPHITTTMSEAIQLDARVLSTPGQHGWRGLASNGRSILLTLFASLGGVLYGYNQGVFGQVQVMSEFTSRYSETVSDIPQVPLRNTSLTMVDEQPFSQRPSHRCTGVGGCRRSSGSWTMCRSILAKGEPRKNRPQWDRISLSSQYTISGFCVIFIAGAAIQTGATSDVGFIYGEFAVHRLRC